MRFIVVLVCALVLAPAVAAAGCPTKPVAERGGEHWCYSAGTRGNVHLWKPAGYDAKTAITVVYVHGYNLGFEGCSDRHYLDCVWDAHGLSGQFAASGLGALFVAVEAPVDDSQRVKWKSLEAVSRSVAKSGGITPPEKTVAMAHSAGIFTVMRFLDDARLAHVVALDALYLDSPKRLARWYAQGGRRLTLLGADARHAQTAVLAKRLKCDAAAGFASPYPNAARCLFAVDASVKHMSVVTGWVAIPSALKRVSSPSKPKTVKKPRQKRAKHRRK